MPAPLISVSQETSGGALDIAPDGTFSTSIPNHHFTTYLQRRGGLNISAAAALVDACAVDGEILDRVGDSFANNVEHNRRHNRTLNKTYDMVSAVAVGQVGKGDKADEDATAALNAGTVVDIFELEGDEATGGDSLHEVKVPSPTTKTRKAGKGSARNGGNPESCGHQVAFGNTEEFYRREVFGLKGRGRARDGPFDHKTGRRWVKAHKGTYHDALHVKRSRVSLMLVVSDDGRDLSTLAHGHRVPRPAGPRQARQGLHEVRRLARKRDRLLHPPRPENLHGRRHRRGRGDPPGNHDQETGPLRRHAKAGARGRGLNRRRPAAEASESQAGSLLG